MPEADRPGVVAGGVPTPAGNSVAERRSDLAARLGRLPENEYGVQSRDVPPYS